MDSSFRKQIETVWWLSDVILFRKVHYYTKMLTLLKLSGKVKLNLGTNLETDTVQHKFLKGVV